MTVKIYITLKEPSNGSDLAKVLRSAATQVESRNIPADTKFHISLRNDSHTRVGIIKFERR